jgi:hypothetical protein
MVHEEQVLVALLSEDEDLALCKSVNLVDVEPLGVIRLLIEEDSWAFFKSGDRTFERSPERGSRWHIPTLGNGPAAAAERVGTPLTGPAL